MGHGVVFVSDMADKNHLHSLQEKGLIRASVNVAQGVVDAIAFGQAGTESLGLPNDVCGAGGMMCDRYAVENLLPFILTHGEPAPLIAFVPMEIENGRRRDWQAAVEKAATETIKGDYLAAGHLFGAGRYNALVEVMSHSLESFHKLLLATTDVVGVRTAHVLRVDGKDTRGMGTTGG